MSRRDIQRYDGARLTAQAGGCEQSLTSFRINDAFCHHLCPSCFCVHVTEGRRGRRTQTNSLRYRAHPSTPVGPATKSRIAPQSANVKQYASFIVQNNQTLINNECEIVLFLRRPRSLLSSEPAECRSSWMPQTPNPQSV